MEHYHQQNVLIILNIAKWEWEKGYVLVETCGIYNKNLNFTPDINKIEAINKELWKK